VKKGVKGTKRESGDKNSIAVVETRGDINYEDK
jgi:hypothetical protein